MQEKDAIALLKKYIDGNCTDEEKAMLESWYLKHDTGELNTSDAHKEEQLNEVFLSLFEQDEPVKNTFPYRLAAAALLLIALSVAAIFIIKQKDSTGANRLMANDIKPGGNRAMLKLSNGNSISLNNRKNGQIAEEPGVKVVKIANGQVVYQPLTGGNADKSTPVKLNKLSTPNGGQYEVTLCDGTRVWLNAASSIEYPSSFTGNERNVTLTGEAYFEVAKNPAKPFKVHARDVNIRVLGTHFNVMAYKENGAVKTTLLEGSVRLYNNYTKTLLTPGQQGYMADNFSKFNVSKVKTSSITAWKQGWFEFDNTSLHTLMGEISRWYDVKIIYEAGVKDDVFFGRIMRSSNLSETLKILTAGGMHFEIKNNTLIVKP